MSNVESGQTHAQKRLLSIFFSKQVPPIPTEEERLPHAEKEANFVSKIFFWWLNPILKVGYKRTLQSQDLFKLTDDLKVDKMADEFTTRFATSLVNAQNKHILKKCKKRGETPETSSVSAADDLADFKVPRSVMLLSLFMTFKWQYSRACLYLALSGTGQATNPLLSKKLIKFVERKVLGYETGVGKGIGYAIGATAVVFVSTAFTNHTFYNAMMTGSKAKAVLIKAILEKSFKLSAASNHQYPSGKITTLMGADLSRIDFAIGFQPFLITFPVPIIIAIAILIVNIGVSSLVGIGLMFVFLFIIMISAKKLFAFRGKANSFTDKRVNYIKEALNNLKIIKFYSWEPSYYKNISDVRRQEMKIVRQMQSLRVVIMSLAMSISILTSMVSFLVLYAIGSNKRNPASLFSSISLFNILSTQVLMLPLALASGSDAFSGAGRVAEFLAASEIDLNSIKIEASGEEKAIMDKEDVSVELVDASFEWETFDNDDDAEEEKKDKEVVEKTVSNEADSLDSTKEKYSSDSEDNTTTMDAFTGLHNLNLSIKKNEFIVITGLIGSGKSSLLSALSGFMKRTSGTIKVNGSLLFCGYPWVQNATVKENILFGEPYDEKRYADVIYACSLESDLEILPAGDNTEIGERGITLSGGQKARINLARAVYAKKEIILLDDVLSAVDAGVGKHIMNNCILDLLGDSTRILATHQLSLISAASRIIFLNGDGTIDVGTLEELRERNTGFEKLMTFNNEVNDEESVEAELESLDEEEDKPAKVKVEQEEIRKDYKKNSAQDGTLVQREGAAVNSISAKIYGNYLKEGSGVLGPYIVVPAFILLVAISTFCQLFTNTWLSFWTSNKFPGRSNGFYIGIYVMFSILTFFLILCEFLVLVYMTNTAAIKLNIRAIKKVLHSPMSFMDTTPTGRILNRFTKDTEVIDSELGDQVRFMIFSAGMIVGVLILCVCYLPWFAIAIPFIVLSFVSIADYFQAGSREIKRVEAVQRSLVYNNFNEILSGMTTIKAYKAENMFLRKNTVLIDQQNEATFLTLATQRWLGIHMDCISSCFVLLITLLCVCRVFNISASAVGLLISYVFQIAGQLSLLMRSYTQVQDEMNSVERLSQYAFDLKEEAPYVITETTPHESWPTHGAIKFEHVNMAYRPGLPLVLKDLSIDIKPSEKVGICGRTGAGKSSIMTALYRLSELEGGSIKIDDIDISRLGLQALRSKLSIIPQDPVLFRGNIRKNLDPFDQSSDDKLWDALRRTGLIEASKLEAVKKQVKQTKSEKDAKSKKKDSKSAKDSVDDNDELHKFHLDQSVEDEGSNFSLGERQLIAFARALIRDPKILILDEATSSVDYETDSKIQDTIAREFGDCTILCIAHRLRTIINYNKILVMDQGEVREFDTPYNLFKQEGSIFRQMCDKSSITEEDFANTKAF